MVAGGPARWEYLTRSSMTLLPVITNSSRTSWSLIAASKVGAGESGGLDCGE